MTQRIKSLFPWRTLGTSLVILLLAAPCVLTQTSINSPAHSLQAQTSVALKDSLTVQYTPEPANLVQPWNQNLTEEQLRGIQMSRKPVVRHFKVDPVNLMPKGDRSTSPPFPGFAGQWAYATGRKKNSVYALLTITNVSNRPVTFCAEQFNFTAAQVNWGMLDRPAPPPDSLLSAPLTLKPYMSLSVYVDLRKWMNFDKPGKYFVSASSTLSIQNSRIASNPAQSLKVYHNQFTVEVAQ